MPSLEIVPAYSVNLKQNMSLLDAITASSAGYMVVSDNPVHREFLNKLLNKP